MLEGNYNISVRFEDAAGNIAFANTTIDILIDNTPPKIVRVYEKASDLIVITDEDSICKATINPSIGCSFNFSSSKTDVKSLIGASKIHSTDFLRDKTYYIKCQDGYGNANDVCAIVVKSYR